MTVETRGYSGGTPTTTGSNFGGSQTADFWTPIDLDVQAVEWWLFRAGTYELWVDGQLRATQTTAATSSWVAFSWSATLPAGLHEVSLVKTAGLNGWGYTAAETSVDGWAHLGLWQEAAPGEGVPVRVTADVDPGAYEVLTAGTPSTHASTGRPWWWWRQTFAEDRLVAGVHISGSPSQQFEVRRDGVLLGTSPSMRSADASAPATLQSPVWVPFDTPTAFTAATAYVIRVDAAPGTSRQGYDSTTADYSDGDQTVAIEPGNPVADARWWCAWVVLADDGPRIWKPTPVELTLEPGVTEARWPQTHYTPAPVDLSVDLGPAGLLIPSLIRPAPVDLVLDPGVSVWAQTVWEPAPVVLDLIVGAAQANWPNPPMHAGALDLDVTAGSARVGIATRPGQYPTPDDAPGWSARVVTMTGDLIAELPHVLDVRLVDELNATRAAQLVVPKYAPGSGEIRSLGTEIQLWRNDDLMCWGPVVARGALSGDGALSVQVRDPWWYIQRRFFGAPNRVNLVRNGGFEAAGRWSAARCTFARTSDRAFEGSMSARLDCPEAGRDAYLVQQFTPPALGGAGGTRNTVTVSAWVWIDPGMWLGPAANSVGLRLAIGGPRPRSSIATIDDGTDRGQWVQLTTRLAYSTADQGAPMTVRLGAPGGRVWWDAVIAARPENTSTGPDPGVDQAVFAAEIVRYAQTGRGKSPVHIGTATPPTGVNRVRRWLHADHDPIEAAITELVEAEDGIDWSLDLTPTTRTFRTHYPRRGQDRTGGDDPVVLRSGTPADGGTVASWTWSEDGTTTATSVIALGPGAGTTRAEGGAIDTSDLDGLILERVAAAPDGMEIRDLDPWARADLAVAGRLGGTLTLTSHPADHAPGGVSRLIHDVHPGDVVTVQIDDGPVQIDGPHRVLRREIQGRPETVTFTVTSWEP